MLMELNGSTNPLTAMARVVPWRPAIYPAELWAVLVAGNLQLFHFVLEGSTLQSQARRRSVFAAYHAVRVVENAANVIPVHVPQSLSPRERRLRGIARGGRFKRRANFWTKCSTSTEMLSGRSRSAGTRTGKTLNR